MKKKKPIECDKKGDMNMSCTPWSNEKERADYYENLYKEQFAEIDRLNKIRAELSKEIERKDRILESYALQYGTATDKEVLLKQARAESIKEFAERLKEKLQLNRMVIGYNGAFVEDIQIDNLVKEMTESDVE